MERSMRREEIIPKTTGPRPIRSCSQDAPGSDAAAPASARRAPRAPRRPARASRRRRPTAAPTRAAARAPPPRGARRTRATAPRARLRQLRRRHVLSLRVEEHERTLVDDVELAEEALRRPASRAGPPIELGAAAIASLRVEAQHGPLRMHARRRRDAPRDAHPIARRRRVTKRHARLRGAPGTRVHADEESAPPRRRVLPICAHEARVRVPRVAQRVIDVRDAAARLEPVERVAKVCGGGEDAHLCRAFGCAGKVLSASSAQPPGAPHDAAIASRRSFKRASAAPLRPSSAPRPPSLGMGERPASRRALPASA